MSEDRKKSVKLSSYSESMKLEVLGKLSSGEHRLSDLAARYGIPVSTISTWNRKGLKRSKDQSTIVKGRVYMGEEDQKIRDLESALAESLLKNKLYEKMFEYAKEDYGIELKKNAANGQYSLVKHNTVLPKSVKP
jgi:transposase-like protein